MAKDELKTASVLAFERKLCNSDGLMYAGRWEERSHSDNWQPIALMEKAVRGTISNRLKATIANNPVKLDAEIDKPNLQMVDIAALPFDKDTLNVRFTLKVLGNLSTPSACNNPDYQKALSGKIESYAAAQGYDELSWRYAENLANGRFLWRNRIGADAIEIEITQKENGKDKASWKFDALSFNIRSFTQHPDLAGISRVIKEGLSGETLVFLSVSAFVRLGAGQEVYPSQELVLSKEEKSKYLYSVDNTAAMHSQKIGNAIRTIDTWYPQAQEFGPISVEPYGSVTSRGKAFRSPKDKLDFYTLLDNWILKDKAPEVEQQHYVIAGLIRGGVFGESEK